jgi:hypothetical protein
VKLGELRTSRHNALRDLLTSRLRSLDPGAHVEAEALLAGPTRRRCDVRWAHGPDVRIFDVAVVCPSADHALRKGSANEPLVAAAEMEAQKRRKYAMPLVHANLQEAALHAVVFETSARPGAQAQQTSNWLAAAAAANAAGPGTASSFISTAAALLWSYNARILSAVQHTQTAVMRT